MVFHTFGGKCNNKNSFALIDYLGTDYGAIIIMYKDADDEYKEL